MVLENCELADGFLSRLVGWQFRRAPAAGTGLLLVPCGSIHTCFLRFGLDLVLLDQAGRVLDVRCDVRPWRAVVAPKGTHAVLELATPGPEIEVGRTLRARSSKSSPFPKSLQFLT